VITATSLEHLKDLEGKEGDFFPIQRAYEHGVLSRSRDDRSGVLHPSAVGMCARRGVYELLGYDTQDKYPANLLEIFEIGHKVHDIIQTRLREDVPKALGALRADLRTWDVKEYSFREEVTYDPETDEMFKNYRIGGTCDGILEVSGEGWSQRGVVEIKSISKGGFEKLTTTSAKSDHLMQAHLYAYRFDCPIIWVMYYCKDNSQMRVYPVLFDEKIFEEAFHIMQLQYNHSVAGTLPDREESWFECKTCKYAHHCHPTILNKKGKGRAKVRPSRNGDYRL
jgi:CRISPR/Cas system-associated exonuclease Cas4 (RecB family)